MLIVNRTIDKARARDDRALLIALVNNMPDAALTATERQFRDLLAAASDGFATRLRLFSLAGVPRAPQTLDHMRRYYQDASELADCAVDGVIITGTEPRAASLTDEPYWPALAELVDWAEDSRISTIWSCLAAHAAVLHTDGIRRRRMDEKLSGVFECAKTTDHCILTGGPSRWRVPHSRFNDLPEQALIAGGYQLISRSPEVGADIFVRERGALAIFLQGHPEYDPDTLFREYRRDVRRFLANERDTYPKIPCGYFGPDTAAAFAEFEERAKRDRHIDMAPLFTPTRETFAWMWREHAVRLYRNWLAYLADHRGRRPSLTMAQSSARAFP